MPTLMMKNNCNDDDDIGSEFCYSFNLDNTIENVHSQNNKLELVKTGEFNQYEQLTGFSLPCGDLQYDAYLRTQIAGQDNKSGEGADFMDDGTFTLLKGLITESRTSSPYYEEDHQLNSLYYVNQDGHGIPATTNPTWDFTQSCDPLNHSLTEDSVPFNVGTSAGVLTNATSNDFMPIDELAITSGRYGVLPSIEKTEEGSIAIDKANSFGATATMCYNSVHFSHWIDQNLTGPLPDLADLPDIHPDSFLPTPRKNITLVLDLDETLIHSSAVDRDGADFSFPMYHGSKEHTVYVKKRPHVDTFLQKVSEMFKDLTVIVADLAKVVIIDNSPEVFRLQEENGIPIESWTSDPADKSLVELLPFLEAIAVADDVRPIIAQILGRPRSIA
uniref:Mitochondrial import inner membrane translocase subunit TIM50 n=1 Tax=Oryza punctata TaxID=4537 RepID=A0A0E0L5T2_ORYPU